MALKPGTKNDLVNSMAAAMETAFDAEWVNFKNSPPPGAGREDLRLMFIAIAQGVVEHLLVHATDFTIESGFVKSSMGSGTVKILTNG